MFLMFSEESEQIKTLQHTITGSMIFLEQLRPYFLRSSRPPATNWPPPKKKTATVFQKHVLCDIMQIN